MTHSQKVALITGSGRDRIGQYLARDLAGQGYAIAIHYHSSEEEARDQQAEFTEQGIRCEIFQADLSQEDQIKNMFSKIKQAFGRLDVCVCTASIWSAKPLEEVGMEELTKQFTINAAASFLCASQAGQMMIEQETGGSIVLFGDQAIGQPYRNHAAYFVSKGCLPTMTKVLAVELAAKNPSIRVNLLQPGPILFPPDATEAEIEQLRASTLVQQADCPELVAHAVRFLNENEFITGAEIPLDGGRSIAYARDMKRNE